MTTLPKLFVNQKVVKAVIVYKEVHDAKTRAKITKYFIDNGILPEEASEDNGEFVQWDSSFPK